MKRLLKLLLYAVGLLLALAVAAAIALPFLVDVNDFKPQIHAALEREIGREVTIDGDIELSVFPWLGVTLDDVAVANDPAFADTPLAQIATLDLSARLLPLLRGEIEVGTVGLEGLRLDLVRNASGRYNWDGILEHMDDRDSAQASEPVPADEEDDGGLSLNAVQVEAIRVTDAAGRYRDESRDRSYRFTGLDLSTGRLQARTPVRVESAGTLEAVERGLTLRFDLAGRVQPDLAERFYRLDNASASLILAGEDVPGGEQQVSLTTDAEYDGDEGRLKLADLSLQGLGLNLAAQVDGTGLNEAPRFSGRVTLRRFDPRSALRNLGFEPPATRDAGVLSTAGFDAQFGGSPERIGFKQMLVQLDDTTLRGTASIEDFDTPRLGMDLSLDRIDIDRYRPPETADAAATGEDSVRETDASDDEPSIGLDLLEAVRLDGRLTAGELVFGGLRMRDAELSLSVDDGRLSIAPLTADLYDGSLVLEAEVDGRQAQPAYALSGHLDGLRFAPLLGDIAGSDAVSALANITLDLRTEGHRVAELKRGLDGRFGFDLRDGAFKGFNLAQLLARARQQLAGGETPAEAPAETPFNRFAGEFGIQDGVLDGQALSLSTRYIEAGGQGRYDLAENRLDYTVDAGVSDQAEGRLAALAGLTVPIRLTGALLSPDYAIDLRSVIQDVARRELDSRGEALQREVRERLDERRQSLEQSVGERLGEGLRGLFGGSAAESESAPTAEAEGQSAEGEPSDTAQAPESTASADEPAASGEASAAVNDADTDGTTRQGPTAQRTADTPAPAGDAASGTSADMPEASAAAEPGESEAPDS